jgi:hypothetical protein
MLSAPLFSGKFVQKHKTNIPHEFSVSSYGSPQTTTTILSQTTEKSMFRAVFMKQAKTGGHFMGRVAAKLWLFRSFGGLG